MKLPAIGVRSECLHRRHRKALASAATMNIIPRNSDAFSGKIKLYAYRMESVACSRTERYRVIAYVAARASDQSVMAKFPIRNSAAKDAAKKVRTISEVAVAQFHAVVNTIMCIEQSHVNVTMLDVPSQKWLSLSSMQ